MMLRTVVLFILYTDFIHNTDCCVYGPSPECLFPCRCESDARCDPVTGECPDSQCIRAPPYDDHFGWNDTGCRRGNIAYNKWTDQSGVWQDNTADRAVDGNTNPDLGNGNSCAYPTNGPGGSPAWWMVDLGKKHVVEEIIIFNRNTNREYTNDFYILIGMTPDINEQETCAFFSDDNYDNFDTIPIKCRGGLVEGRYVTMQRALGSTSQHAINICEFVVMGYEPTDCGNNCHDTCHVLTGCTTCKAGFSPPDCVAGCYAYNWGINCHNLCGACSNNDACDTKSGECPNGCITWYAQHTCQVYIEIPSLEHAAVELNASSSTEIKVKWNQFQNVKDALGNHYFYKVEYRPTGDDKIESEIVWHDSNVQYLSISLTGLASNTEYEVTIAPYRVDGEVEERGHATATRRNKTLSIANQSPGTAIIVSLAVGAIGAVSIVTVALSFYMRRKALRLQKNPDLQIYENDSCNIDPNITQSASSNYENAQAADYDEPTATYDEIRGQNQTVYYNECSNKKTCEIKRGTHDKSSTRYETNDQKNNSGYETLGLKVCNDPLSLYQKLN